MTNKWKVVESGVHQYFFNVVCLNGDPEATTMQEETKINYPFRVEVKEPPFRVEVKEPSSNEQFSTEVVAIKLLGFDLNNVLHANLLEAVECLVHHLRDKLGWTV